ncbi:protein translocase subunit SecDF [uncultured Acetobacteroides sp.]|uniref:protein translocase subunit SecDF n=1 Tax=uncultured Acetobacteroides sp. TaxID=1760811 RepID=UPI0029F50CD4|nr:protein translocase subunit SecDF [uncultured Acetobacteroides sp.]
MQNRGAISFIAIVLAVACLYQLSFTFVASRVEKKAEEYATVKGKNGIDSIDNKKLNNYLDSMKNQPAYLFNLYTFQECKDRQLNLGLDLKGGMNVTLEVSVPEILKSLSNHSADASFNKAIELAKEMQKSSKSDFVTLFGKAYEQVAPNEKLSKIFGTYELKSQITPESTNAQVLDVLRKQTDGAIANSFNVLRNRIDRFGVVQPNIQRLGNTGRILVELPGVKDPSRVRKLLQGTANLQFFETYELTQLVQPLMAANAKVAEIVKAGGVVKDTTMKGDSTKVAAAEPVAKTNTLKKELGKGKGAEAKSQTSLFSLLQPYIDGQGNVMPGSIVGTARISDTAKVNAFLAMPAVKALFPRDLALMWSVKPVVTGPKKVETDRIELYAIRITGRDGKAPLDGSVIVDASKQFDDKHGSVDVSMRMNSEGAKTWARLTGDNVGRQIAIVLDGLVYSAPRVNQAIEGGSSSISGTFTTQEADDLANVLNSGKLPAPAKIVQEDVVGPSLGQESINAGMLSFIIAFLLVLGYMIFFYSGAGLVANVALVANVFLLFGVLASFKAVLTLPGIAGIVLTMGMAVDANVIIYERIKEELRTGKGVRLALTDGFKHALPSIIDGQLTTLITGIALYIFGSGPIQGFATTLIIGIMTSLFTSLFISHLVFDWWLNKGRNIKFYTDHTKNFLANTNFDFVGVRKYAYIFSITVITLGTASWVIKGFNYGVDFTGGRTYTVRFDQDVHANDVRAALSTALGESPEVKQFGSANQMKITTKYLIHDNKSNVDSIISTKLYQSLNKLNKTSLTYDEFATTNKTSIGIISSSVVGPSVADDIKLGAIIAVIVSLIAIFIYIAIRFKRWQWGLGGVASLFHDTMFVLGFYSLFSSIMPFNMDVDMSFIAAILTIIGYSINDTVIIFDRIREYRREHPNRSLKVNINQAINSTLSRTVNTVGTVLVVLFAIFFFGGDVIRGFAFALLVGVGIGTFSSVLVATPIAYDLFKVGDENKLAEGEEK